jgi:photosystem II stability/assembly factor-like uncharacterized protein
VEQASRPHRRAAALIALAVIVMASASAAYLHSTAPKSPPPARAVASAISPPFSTSDPVNFNFATQSSGWAVLSVAPSGGGQFQVFRTIDGAQHWQLQLQGQGTFSGVIPLSVRLLDDTNGFMAIGGPGKQLYRTTDGGAHWASVSLPPSPRVDSAGFSDPTHGLLLTGPVSTRPQPLNLYATVDAGRTWQLLPDPPVDAYNLSVATTETWLGSLGQGPPHVYRSSDGGQSWRTLDLPAPSTGSWDTTANLFQVVGEALPDAGVVVSVLCECTRSGPFYFTSFDGGTSWANVPVPQGNIAYQDALHWWAINGTVLLKSPDAGRTWAQVSDRLPNWRYVTQVLDTKHAWALLILPTGFGLGSTNDGGLHWTLAAVPQAAYSP